MATDKKILVKGIQYLGWALPLFFIGPVAINSSFRNQGHPFYYIVLVIGIIFCLCAMLFTFMGLRTIVKSIF